LLVRFLVVPDDRPMAVTLSALVAYCDKLLAHGLIRDYEGARNGLQLANDGKVRHVAAAVDANVLTLEASVAAGADLLLVHHGLGWSPLCPLTGRRYEALRNAMNKGLAVYSSHLPLDAHPRFGNNALLAQALGLRGARPFFEEFGTEIGRMASAKLERGVLLGRLEKALGGPVYAVPAGPAVCRKIGIVTGGAGSQMAKAAAAGADTFITGEGPHHTFGLAHELGVNLIHGGHYRTETFGVRALMEHLAGKFRLKGTFLDYPSGL
jgi:dinuclear metal center YbgI/SA1388 family protein